MSLAQAQFDRDYQIVRRLVLSGRYDVSTAKSWLAKHGGLASEALLQEQQERARKLLAFHADREVEQIIKAEEADGTRGNDDE